MKVHDVEQGTSAWLELRAGIPTSSEFDKILTPTGKKSKSAGPYMHKLIAERLMGHPVVEYVSLDMDRGARLEEQAVSFYEFKYDVDTEPMGFVTNDAQTIGCSPDRRLRRFQVLPFIRFREAGDFLFHPITALL